MVRHRHIAAVVAIAVGLTPSLAPIASADPAPLAPGDSPTVLGYSGPVSQPSSPPHLSTTAAPPHTVVRVVASHDGFDWGDAGIGAGAMLLLLGIGLAGTLVATNARRRDIREQRAVATN